MSSLNSYNEVPPTQPKQPDSMQRYSTVTVIVHGVGDHTPTNIFHEIESGVRSFMPANEPDGIKVSEIELPKEVSSSGPAQCSISGTRIDMQSESHLIVALIWANTRPRAVRSWTKHLHAGTTLQGSRDDPSTFRERSARIAAGPSAIKEFLHSARNLLYKAKQYLKVPLRSHGLWRFPASLTAALFLSTDMIAGLLGLILFPLTPLILSGFVYLVLFLVFGMVIMLIDAIRYGTLLGAVDWRDWRPMAICIGTGLAICVLDFALGRAFIVFDLAADVAAYVSDAERRQRLTENTMHFISTIGEYFADAQMIVVGHSLGSVLISHTVCDITFSRPQRLVLLTLGSPLPLMSRVFPGIVKPPERLLDEYKENNSVRCWFNFYRNGDVIGRSLGVKGNQSFIEASLGNGPHWNYYSDQRLWEKVAHILTALKESNRETLTPPVGNEAYPTPN